MGLLRKRTDAPGGERFLMREKLLSIGDDYWIESPRSGSAWFRVRDACGVDVAPGEDVALILAITVAIDSLTTRD